MSASESARRTLLKTAAWGLTEAAGADGATIGRHMAGH